MKLPNEIDDSMFQDDEIGSESEAGNDERQSDHNSEPKDDSLDASPDSDNPPDWLYETVGLGDQSGLGSSEIEPDDELSSGVGDTGAPLGGVVFPDWLTSQKKVDDEKPGSSEESVISEDSSFDEFATLVGQTADYDFIPGADAGEVDGEGDGPDLDSGVTESMEAAMNGVLEDPAFSQADEQEELEDELKWLEEIAASHDASDEIAFGGDSGAEALVPFPEDEYIPDWLKEDLIKDTVQETVEPEPVSSDQDRDSFELTTEIETLDGDEFPDWLSDQSQDETIPSQEDTVDDADWFNQIVSGDEAAIDELLAVQGIDLESEDESLPADSGEEQPTWYSELDEIPGPIDETLIGESFLVDEYQAVDAIQPEEYSPPQLVEGLAPGEDVAPEEGPIDSEEAMAWLEQLAQEHDSVEDETSDEVEAIETTDIAVESPSEMLVEDDEEVNGLASEVPEDPDEAMAWLDQLAAEQGAPDDELWSFEVEDEGETEEQISPPEVDGELQTALAAISDVSLPSDHDEALSWLEELALGARLEPDLDSAMDDIFAALPDELEGEREVYKAEIADDSEATEPAMDMDELQLAAMIAAAEILDLETEDEDESTGEISAEMSASEEALLDELIGELEIDAVDETLPGTMISEAYVEDGEIEESGAIAIDETLPGTLMSEVELIDEDDADDIGHDALDEKIAGTLVAAAALADELERADYEATPGDPMQVDEVVELAETEADDGSEAEGEDLDWLDTLDEANVTGWLMAEQALLAEEKDSRDDYAQPTFDVSAEPVTESREETTAPEQILSAYQFDDHGIPDLASAQSALNRGQLPEAHDAYSALIDSGESLPYIITDLEMVAEITESQPDFMKLLGDAYSRNGQLQKAIEIYRLALDNL